jgi:hypothetical protein
VTTASLNIVTPGLAFDPIEHRYSLDGHEFPGVTRIIRSAGLMGDTSHYTPESRERGSETHKAIHFHNEGDLDPATLDPRVQPYFEAYLRFEAESRKSSFAAELVMAHPALGYAGTVDDLAWLLGGGNLCQIDYKTGALQPWHWIQLAAYAELVRVNARHLGLAERELPGDMAVCCLAADGRYHLKPESARPFGRREAWGFFVSALNSWNFRKEHCNGFDPCPSLD